MALLMPPIRVRRGKPIPDKDAIGSIPKYIYSRVCYRYEEHIAAACLYFARWKRDSDRNFAAISSHY